VLGERGQGRRKDTRTGDRTAGGSAPGPAGAPGRARPQTAESRGHGPEGQGPRAGEQLDRRPRNAVIDLREHSVDFVNGHRLREYDVTVDFLAVLISSNHPDLDHFSLARPLKHGEPDGGSHERAFGCVN
jgi:hypothetical protein